MDNAGSEPASATQVLEHELEHHIGKTSGEPLVGLALSGGGIRSATFGLGVLQALDALGLFRRLDYVSTVSGGGYIGGWLQAALANNRRRPDALGVQGDEPWQIRFLRAYSNYLTPKLGLFSGDTWAAVGNTTRNLILNFSILSLSLMAPLYAPWIAAVLFWQLVPWLLPAPLPWPSMLGLLAILALAAVLFVLVVAESAANMAIPVAGGGWAAGSVSPSSPTAIFWKVIIPGLAATWLSSAVLWSFAQKGALRTGRGLALAALAGAASYGLVWACGLRLGLRWRDRRSNKQWSKEIDYGRGVTVGAIIVGTGIVAGALGMFLLGLALDALATAFQGGQNTWLLALLSFPIGVVCLLVAISAHIGLAGDFLSNETREWWGRVGGIQLLVTLLITALGTLALAGPHAFALLQQQGGWFERYAPHIQTTLGVLWAVLTGAGVAAGRSKRTAGGGGNRVMEFVGKVAPAVFVVGYVLILAMFMHGSRYHPRPGDGTGAPLATFNLCDVEQMLRANSGVDTDAKANDAWSCSYTAASLGASTALSGLALMMLVAGGLAYFISWRVDLNEFSLHTLYRNRLVRCYLGASRTRRPHPFTGFDSEDDLPLTLAPRPPLTGVIRPYPIFNAAINLVGGRNLAWQTRKAASFIFTPDYCGFEYRNSEPRKDGADPGLISAYAPTVDHAGDPRSLTLGLAVATSGAAASPNMGYHTSPTLSFLMTVFNVRLGWWLRNPRKAGVWTNVKNRLSLKELLYELGGMTTDDKDWVYLSDGGHFENLGVYELVRRRCRFIIACDAGQDGDVTFEDLGNAIEKCRTDFGVNIEIDLAGLHPVSGRSERHCAIGTIRYDRLAERDAEGAPLAAGTLLYIKSSLTGDEPADVLRYAAEHPAFPHESTNDQFFDESQFESYRALGFHAVRDVFRSALGSERCGTLDDVEIFMLLRQRWGVAAPAPADAVSKYSAALDRIWSVVRTNKRLRFLDAQMFPEMPALIGLPAQALPDSMPVARPDVNYWLPKTERQRREGFYVCVQMLQLMEDVFLDFDLDQYYDHIDNRGWMNLFQHWAWSGMLCATWAMVGSTFDPRFQRFCWRRLDLRPGATSVAAEGAAVALPHPKQWRAWLEEAEKDPAKARPAAMTAATDEWRRKGGLNFWEMELVEKYMRSTGRLKQTLWPVHVTVESPRRSDKNPLRFNVGYIIGELEGPDDGPRTFVLHYMRIQNHLRKMGLARDALLAVQKNFKARITVPEPLFDEETLDQKASDEALPTEGAVKQLRAVIRSLPVEIQ